MVRGWATDEQRQLLEQAIPSYTEHQKAHSLHEFWPTFFAKFLRQFPVAPSEAEIALANGDAEAASRHPDVLKRRRERLKVCASLLLRQLSHADNVHSKFNIGSQITRVRLQLPMGAPEF